MVLGNPKIVGPISELTTPNGIRVQGQTTGYTVAIYDYGSPPTLVGKDQVRGSDVRIPINLGVGLHAGMRLYAMQEGDGDSSVMPTGDNLETVQPGPTDPRHLNAVSFQSQVYQCALYIWTTGGYPGATVEVSAGGNVLGSAPILEGFARIELNQGIPRVSNAFLTQVVPSLGFRGNSLIASASPIPLVQGAPLPPPKVQLPLRGCDATLKLSEVYEGARVTIKRASGLVETVGLGVSSSEVILTEPLKTRDRIQVSQSVWEKCERPSDISEPFPVEKADPVEPPVIFSPLCAGSQLIMLKGLRGNSLVTLINETQTIKGLQTPPDVTEWGFPIPPLIPGTISATQEICGITSLPSASLPVSKHSEHIDPPSIEYPLYGCARNVTIQGAHPGGSIRVYAVTTNGEFAITGLIFVEHSQLVVSVFPWLQPEWKGLRVFQWACKDTAVESGLFSPIIPKARLLAPVLREPVYQGDRFVNVDGTVPGAHVELFVVDKEGSRIFAGDTDASQISPTSIGIDARVTLKEGERVQARQILCANSDGAGSEISNTQDIQPAYQPRPFYIVGHNPNKLDEARDVLSAGANAIEPDISAWKVIGEPDVLVVSHSGSDILEPNAPRPITLINYLIGLRQVAADFPNLSLIYFDCKPTTATPDHGYEILMAVRKYLTFDTPIPFIISVSSLDQSKIFDRIRDILGPREGLMVDEENDAGSVATTFDNLGVGNRCFGNGSTAQHPILVPNLRYSIEWACALRAGFGTLKAVYEWTANDRGRWVEFIRIGVDGMITDHPDDLYREVQTESLFSPIRMGTREDNPFNQPNSQYTVICRTGDVRMGGTDSRVTFTINGSSGSVSRQINTFLNGRMETGETNFVTFHSPDLGEVSSITITKDNGGNGPDWFLDWIGVHSFRYGVHKTANYGSWIVDGPSYEISF
ncbi:hypothetical protein IFR05_005076 [Cadophora sp. M221]|nr:hypothetical protein IFR05_005076 [Cadophora sp. M221]